MQHERRRRAQNSHPARMVQVLALACVVAALVHGADEKAAGTVSVKFRITGLFALERQDDLRTAVSKMPDFTLAAIDFPNGEVTFSYDSAKVLKGAKPDHVQNTIDSQLKQASNHTFGVTAPCAIRDKLTRVEIRVGVLDCKACGLGVYWAVNNIKGVEQTTVSLKDGLVTAWIDTEKTDRAALVKTLKSREIHVKDP